MKTVVPSLTDMWGFIFGKSRIGSYTLSLIL